MAGPGLAWSGVRRLSSAACACLCRCLRSSSQALGRRRLALLAADRAEKIGTKPAQIRIAMTIAFLLFCIAGLLDFLVKLVERKALSNNNVAPVGQNQPRRSKGL
jgi:hypothetical protein